MATTVKCQECGKRISTGYSLDGRGKLYIPLFNPFCTRKYLMKSVREQILEFDLRDE